MLAEFFDRIVALARDAQSVQVFTTPDLPDVVMVRHGDTFEKIATPPPKRAHKINSFADFVAVVNDGKMSTDPEVYVDEEELVVVLDREQRRETIRMPLTETQRFAKLRSLAEHVQPMDPKQAINLIRFDLHGVGADGLVASIKKIDFESRRRSAQVIEHGKESMGRQIESQVTSSTAIPETFTATVPVYANGGLRGVTVGVVVGIYIDTTAEKLVLRPLADEIENAVENAQVQVQQMLLKLVEEVPVFAGKPEFI